MCDGHALLGARLAAYEAALDEFHKYYDSSPPPDTKGANEVPERRGRRGVILLRLQVRIARVFHRKWPDPQEALELCETDFDVVLDLAAQLVATSHTPT